jgi:hypothetical protein
MGNDGMRDKVEHMRQEVNAVSRHCDKFGTEILVPSALKPLMRKESLCPISKQEYAR